MQKSQTVVIGSSDLDYVVTMDLFPKGGETLDKSSFTQATLSAQYLFASNGTSL
jgi:ribokinase